jgi:hypothetical protein
MMMPGSFGIARASSLSARVKNSSKLVKPLVLRHSSSSTP